jgi:hypothetical protein
MKFTINYVAVPKNKSPCTINVSLHLTNTDKYDWLPTVHSLDYIFQLNEISNTGLHISTETNKAVL